MKLILKKKKQIFEENFYLCIESLTKQENLLLQYKEQTKSESFALLHQVITNTNDKIKDEIVRIFDHQASVGEEPNYSLLNGVIELLTEESNKFVNRMIEKNAVAKSGLIYNAKMTLVADMIFHAGTKDKNDLYSVSDGSEDWQLIKFAMTEIAPDSMETCVANFNKLGKDMKIGLVGICKNHEVIPKNNKNLDEFQMKELKKLIQTGQCSRKMEAMQSEKLTDAKLTFKTLGSIWHEKVIKKNKETDDDFELALATPNFSVLKMIFNLSDDKTIKTLKRIFLQDKLPTNLKFQLPIDCMQSVLQQDPNWPDNSHPLIPKDEPCLVADARDLFHSKVLVRKAFESKIQIRLLSNHKLSTIHNMFSEKQYKNRSWVNDDDSNNKQLETIKTEKITENTKLDEIDIEEIGPNEKKLQNHPDKVDDYIDKKATPGEMKTHKLDNFKEDCVVQNDVEKQHFETVMIHVHGGGYVAMSSSTHQHYLISWTKTHDIPIFSIDYRLAPEAKTPDIVNDCIQGYLWVLYFVENALGVKIKNLIVTGDSAGGNMVQVLTNWCIVNGIRKPDLVFPHSPVINCDINTFTPAFQYAWDDPFQNYSTLKMFMKYYIAPHCDPSEDCYISPILTPSWVLKEYPDIFIGIVEYDPLRDDAFRLAVKLLKLEKEVEIIYMRFLRHDPIMYAIKGTPLKETFKYFDATNAFLESWIKKRRDEENSGENDPDIKLQRQNTITDFVDNWVKSSKDTKKQL